jgi:hypothetical protein
MDEQYILDKKEIVKVLMNKIKQIYQYLPKKYQDKGEELVIRDLLETMHLLGFIKQEEEQILVYPIIGKIKGSF